MTSLKASGELSHDDLAVKKPSRILNTVSLDPWQRFLFPFSHFSRQPSDSKKKGSSASREVVWVELRLKWQKPMFKVLGILLVF